MHADQGALSPALVQVQAFINPYESMKQGSGPDLGCWGLDEVSNNVA